MIKRLYIILLIVTHLFLMIPLCFLFFMLMILDLIKWLFFGIKSEMFYLNYIDKYCEYITNMIKTKFDLY